MFILLILLLDLTITSFFPGFNTSGHHVRMKWPRFSDIVAPCPQSSSILVTMTTITTSFALEDISLSKHGVTQTSAAGETGIRIYYQWGTEKYYGVITRIKGTQLTVARPDQLWIYMNGDIVLRGWYGWDDPECTIKKHQVIHIVGPHEMEAIGTSFAEEAEEAEVTSNNPEAVTHEHVEDSMEETKHESPAVAVVPEQSNIEGKSDSEVEPGQPEVGGAPGRVHNSEPTTASPTVTNRVQVVQRKSARKSSHPTNYSRYNSRGNDE